MPRGWPKGKPRGPLSEEHRAKVIAGSRRSASKRRRRIAKMAEENGFMETTPAVWLSAHQHIGDSQYVNDGVDEVLVRALHDRVVYAGSCCCHHETPLQELTVATIAAVEKQYRKKKRGYDRITPAVVSRPPKLGEPMIAKGKLITEWTLEEIREAFKRAEVKERTATYREGRSLTEVVDEMFK